jgi:ubiquinone/menaquinone biosynthesis C-methylase UbiE
MQPRLQRRVQRYGWDKAAACYEQYWQAQLAPAHRRLLELAAIRPGERVLDIACGTGLVTFPAAEAATRAGAVFATDLSDAMVARVKEEARRRGLTQTTAARMDAESLQLPDASFDVALCGLGLMYVPDPAACLREVTRVLAAGGRFVAAVWGARDRCGWAEIFEIVDRRVQSEVCPMFFQLGTGDALRRAMERAGFADLVVDRFSSTLRYESGEDACGAAFAGGPVALAYSRFDARTRDDAHAEYLASIARYRQEEGYEISGEFVVAKGVRL